MGKFITVQQDLIISDNLSMSLWKLLENPQVQC